jgi:hypothetical protein
MLPDHPEEVIIKKTPLFLRMLGFKPFREIRIKRYAGVGGWFEDVVVNYQDTGEPNTQ